jgi:4-amino-4-deoxy-L-arabinose transferase-like glycosyltransferase
MQIENSTAGILHHIKSFRWLSFATLSLALLVQYIMEPPGFIPAAAILYLAALGFLAWSLLKGEWKMAAPPESAQTVETAPVRILPLLASLPLLAAAYYFFGGNQFTLLNVSLWLAGIVLFVVAFWIPKPHSFLFPEKMDWEWTALLAAVFVLVIFFRVYRLDAVPAEPFSDHAEKIMDVYDITQGKTSIFFERNTGREAFQFYWSLLIAKLFGTGFSFLTLKIGTAILGILTLPFIYLLGREFGNPLVGVLALFLFGISYWVNVISRIGLRFPLYPLFAAATLLYLTRGLRTRSRNDFLLCGLFLGIGLHGYTPFRIVPFLVVIGFILFLLHPISKNVRVRALGWLAIVAITSFIIFLPLLHYWVEHPDTFGFRAMSRLTASEADLPNSLGIILVENVARAFMMFNWDDGNTWVNSIPNRPALDVVTGALYMLGIWLVIIRYYRKWDWRDLFLLLSIPVLLMPSILSLAYPQENPALNRAGGAAIAAILISARALEGWLAGMGGEKKRQYVAIGMVAILLSASALQNYKLVFQTFDGTYRYAVWNSTEMAKVIQKHGDVQSAWIIPYWQWVDTRLPAIWLGDVYGDFALWPEEFFATTTVPGPKLFIFHPDDVETETSLRELYPDGTLSRYTSSALYKDFMIFTVEE